MKKLTLLSIIITVLGMVQVNGCKNSDSTPVTPMVTSQVMVVHASPNAPGVDLVVDNARVGTNLTFPHHTEYLSLTPGSHNVKVNVTGTASTVINANLNLTAGTHYSVFAVDSVTNINPLIITDDLSTPASGKAHIRFIHLSPNAPGVDIALQGGRVVFSNKQFKDYTAFVPLDAGTYDLEVRLAGTGTVVLPLNGIVLKDGEIYTVFARGFVGATGAQSLGAEIIVNKPVSGAPVAGNARVLVTHASPDAPGVDLLVGNTVVNSSPLMFPNNTGYLNVPAGSRGIKVNVAGTATTVISANLSLAENANYSVFAVDSVSKISTLVLSDTLTAPAMGKAHVRFVHLSPNAPAVDVAVRGGSVLFGNQHFKEYTAFTPLTAGTYNLEVRLAGTSTVVLSLPGISLTQGKIYTVFAKGFVGGVGAQALGAQIIVNN